MSAAEYIPETEEREPRGGGGGPYWLAAAVAILAAVGILTYGFTHRQDSTIRELNAQETGLRTTIDQLQNQLSAVNDKMSDLAAQQAAQAQAASKTSRTVTRAASDPRIKQMQSRLDAQAQQLNDQQSALNQQRADLEGSISSSHDELNGSIARTHDELVALEQRGERNYDEFDLNKAKNSRFYRVGPISIALRKTDPKHEHYDLAMMVNDKQIQKRNVDLYEPIWLRDSQDPQPLEVVVNQIDKNHIHGYVSSPKYAQAQVAPTSAPAPAPSSQPQSDTAPAGNP